MVSCSGGVGETLRAAEPVEEKVGREEVGDRHHNERRTVIACIHQGSPDVGSDRRQSAGEHAGDADEGGAFGRLQLPHAE